MSRLSNGTTHSCLFRKFLERYQIVSELLFNPCRPNKITFIEIRPLSHLKPPSVFQDRSYEWEVIAITDKEFKVGGLERRISRETCLFLLTNFLGSLFVHRALVPRFLSFKLGSFFSLLWRVVSSRDCCTWRRFDNIFNLILDVLSLNLIFFAILALEIV